MFVFNHTFYISKPLKDGTNSFWRSCLHTSFNGDVLVSMHFVQTDISELCCVTENITSQAEVETTKVTMT